MKCLHCENKMSRLFGGYCEICYQELLSINIKLQQENENLRNQLQVLKNTIYDNQKYKPKHMQEDDNHIPRID